MNAGTIPRPAHRGHVAYSQSDPSLRGRARGEAIAAEIAAGIRVYFELFRSGGLSMDTVRGDAEKTLEAIAAHLPEVYAELGGVAAGAGVPLWQVAALNARTEILARSSTVPPGECSTIIRVPADGNVTGIQTWDWHVELSEFWHTIEARGAARDFVGITEHGILGKIGVNDAGLALHYNVLGHRLDRAEGIPMHILAFVVLSNASNVAAALELIRSLPITSSGSFALFDADGAATLLDITPRGIVEHHPDGGFLLRTNHFLAEGFTAEEKTHYQPGSGDRFALLTRRLSAAPLPPTAAELLPMMVTAPGEAPVTRLPDLSGPFGQRWASLATVILDPQTRSASVLDGTPADADCGPWRELVA